jgi:hypothetical protein
MIPFRELQLDDMERTNQTICASGCYGADYSFANMYIWRNTYNPLVHFTDDWMFIATPKYGVYGYPKGEGDIKEAVNMLLDDAHERGNKLVMRGLTDSKMPEFLEQFGDRFEISEDRDNADYIYTTEKLRFLAGRKLSSKRNHIKHFERNGEWHFDRITAGEIDIAREFVCDFYEEKGDPSLSAEANAINEMFMNYRELDFLGGMLYQNGTPVAFTAGTLLGDKAFDVHFEKAMPDVQGAYTMVNREFVNMIAENYPEVTYINREEDMGIEGLRKAKLSYQPDYLLMKYFAREK